MRLPMRVGATVEGLSCTGGGLPSEGIQSACEGGPTVSFLWIWLTSAPHSNCTGHGGMQAGGCEEGQ